MVCALSGGYQGWGRGNETKISKAWILSRTVRTVKEIIAREVTSAYTTTAEGRLHKEHGCRAKGLGRVHEGRSLSRSKWGESRFKD